MTVTEVQDIFQTQLAQNPKDLFYIVHDNVTASVIRHRLDQHSLQELANNLSDLIYESGTDHTPKFRRSQ